MKADAVMSVIKEQFGYMPDGRAVYSYLMSGTGGMKVRVTEYGGAVMQIIVPDKNGRYDDVVCGYSRLADYIGADGYQGALIGRYGNRIAKGEFTLDGKKYILCKNDGNNSLHGGKHGFNEKIWEVTVANTETPELILHRVSPDGEEGYPGNLDVTVKYKVTDNNSFRIEYFAVTDKKTVINLTNHTYFNLGGYASGTILNHTLMLDADSYLPTDAELIPTGEIKKVDGSPFDFRAEKRIGRDFDLNNRDLGLAGGYDHCFNFVGGEAEKPVLRAVLTCPENGRRMKMYTDQPCVQLYTGNSLKNKEYPFKNGYPQGTQNALCLETQKMPDAVNQSGFTPVILSPDGEYRHTTVYEFSVI